MLSRSYRIVEDFEVLGILWEELALRHKLVKEVIIHDFSQVSYVCRRSAGRMIIEAQKGRSVSETKLGS